MSMEKRHKNSREDFPILKRSVSIVNKSVRRDIGIAYLDNAATMQKPSCVIDAITDYYQLHNANVHRGVHILSEEATVAYEQAREIVAGLIGAKSKEVIFTRGTTDSINIVASTILSIVPPGRDEILVTRLEHHSNLVPWQQLAKRTGMKLVVADITETLALDYTDMEAKASEKTAIIACTHISNAIGTQVDVQRVCTLAKKNGAFVLIDAAQSAGHVPIDVKEIGCDFLAFSGHKLGGPTGIGVLFGRQELLERMEPYQFGGDMVSHVSSQEARWNDLPHKFEAGTPNIAGAIGLGKAAEYMEKYGIADIAKHEHELTTYALSCLSGHKGIRVIAPKDAVPGGIVSLTIEGVHPHDAAAIANEHGVCVRGGHHCCMPLMEHLGVNGTIRLSFAFYNEKSEIDRAIEAFDDAYRMFNADKSAGTRGGLRDNETN